MYVFTCFMCFLCSFKGNTWWQSTCSSHVNWLHSQRFVPSHTVLKQNHVPSNYSNLFFFALTAKFGPPLAAQCRVLTEMEALIGESKFYMTFYISSTFHILMFLCGLWTVWRYTAYVFYKMFGKTVVQKRELSICELPDNLSRWTSCTGIEISTSYPFLFTLPVQYYCDIVSVVCPTSWVDNVLYLKDEIVVSEQRISTSQCQSFIVSRLLIP